MEQSYSAGFVCADTLTWSADAAEGWPTLGEFIEEVSDWYWAHRDELPEPDAVPILGLR